jgi:molecular chaperone DnaK
MQQEAEMHAGDDAKKKELVEIKNTAEMMVYSAEKSLSDAGDKVSAETKKEVEEKITALKAVKDGTDGEAIKSATEALSKEMSKIGEEMMKASEAAAPGAEPKPEDNIQYTEAKETTE